MRKEKNLEFLEDIKVTFNDILREVKKKEVETLSLQIFISYGDTIKGLRKEIFDLLQRINKQKIELLQKEIELVENTLKEIDVLILKLKEMEE
jgi:hypothetical protein